jgi:hypothetical protein
VGSPLPRPPAGVFAPSAPINLAKKINNDLKYSQNKKDTQRH